MTNEQPCLTILALGLRQRCEAERHLGRYLEGSSTLRATLTRPNEGLEATSSEMILQLRKR